MTEGAALTLAAEARQTAAILLLALVLVEYGGTFLLKVARGSEPATPLQQSFFRAGHAHAGVLVLLALVSLLYLGASGLTGAWAWIAGHGAAFAAILMPAGFFLSAAGKGRTRPNRLIVLVWMGAAALAAGVVSLGVGLLR